MHGVRERVLLRHLLEQGETNAAAARQSVVHRATVHRWIEAGLLDTDVNQIQAQYAARPPVPQLLDLYKPVIDARLAEFPALSASRLLEEVRAAGYAVGYTRLRDYVRAIRPVVPVEPLVRFETLPGRQAQVDFAHCRLPWGGAVGLGRHPWLLAAALGALLSAVGSPDAAAWAGGVPGYLGRLPAGVALRPDEERPDAR
jgi:hypothetical protein